MAQAQGGYYVPHQSYWPIIGTIGVTALVVGIAMYLEGMALGTWVMGGGGLITAWFVFGWFSDVVSEGVRGLYSDQVDRSLRWGMIWFIFSEIMFFAAFFGALFYARMLSVPWLSGEDPATSRLLWDSMALNWPTAGPANAAMEWRPMGPWPLPTINTLILLTSGMTLTIAHHALKDDNRTKLIGFMWATVLLGTLFVGLQAYEYYEAYVHLNLRMDTGIYGSTFFMLTGFHGMHVVIGTLMLLVITLRCMKGHFDPKSHFGFEGAAWYWHFVDVVWLGLFIFVYIL
ncbi:cytochrome c oxidase subunit 3 [Spiribacter aquaticus]|jgi:cytochrome c oxidase subunit 3|uniref:cytochrome-c oxidase n=2 Tax=Spiribacter TaxID=1335745 RepID=A0A557RN74_9GAMM|nr:MULTISPECIES: cytochrome c oxidase subunit 3 [Spiribacter]AUB77765.1 MFS transporter [Spiribacter roseus]KAF0279622.1 MFS transporter [Spiribacter roseus]KAF0281812.1 MFS transporter [Spiribacter roseus]KAF0285133.1 MFS transporter [Spiribacter sp. SSL99]TVO66586.1 cytochrome c oxidase subunit 3 [Spiribacter aquaticus]